MMITHMRHAVYASAPTLVAILLVLFALDTDPAPATANQPASDWLSAEQVKVLLRASGYTEITKLEADDGHWDGEGIKNGQRMRFELDPKTGAILGEIAE